MAFDPEEWHAYRAKMNERILTVDNLSVRRFFALDHDIYEAGVLEAKTKELMGLVASLVLRCDDCVRYHIDRCLEEGVTAEELHETLAIGLVVGGSITIPHLRRALEALDAFSE
jgi:AhpD family alkylhydroperoxidase